MSASHTRSASTATVSALDRPVVLITLLLTTAAADTTAAAVVCVFVIVRIVGTVDGPAQHGNLLSAVRAVVVVELSVVTLHRLPVLNGWLLTGLLLPAWSELLKSGRQ